MRSHAAEAQKTLQYLHYLKEESQCPNNNAKLRDNQMVGRTLTHSSVGRAQTKKETRSRNLSLLSSELSSAQVPRPKEIGSTLTPHYCRNNRSVIQSPQVVSSPLTTNISTNPQTRLLVEKPQPKAQSPNLDFLTAAPDISASKTSLCIPTLQALPPSIFLERNKTCLLPRLHCCCTPPSALLSGG